MINIEKYPKLRSLGFAVLTLFIVWHVIAIGVVGPFSKSYLRDGLMNVYEDYLAITKLGTAWPFYAPNPYLGSILRYETVSRDGSKVIYPLSEAREKFDHAYFRYTNFYFYLFNDVKYSKDRGYDKSVARYLCTKNRLNNITSINFILLNQKRFTYEDYRSGKRPLDRKFLDKTIYGPYTCAGE